ncbi:o-succinylbenzoate synthase [Aeromicrobium sp.]|uniref:o-succinylbenzoate synthase n=1 Tax=Aeromicrobium sp. TaxID=1871063 RepID=UPI0019C556E0|nr:o-succinylbenzoate synthase [Aeromicrobium sp.]MBC7631856.1 o-succinylbenzoate synthase [Aeromicrobium sp.]
MQFRTYAIAMPTPFRGITRREGMVVRGPAGWAEFSPFLDYDPTESAPWLVAAIDAAEHEWPPARRREIPVNCTVPAVAPEQAAEIARRSGCRTAKVKVAERGQTLAHDIARVEAVSDAIGPAGKVRVDANGAWSVDEAVVAISLLDRAAHGLEYVEQPCALVEDLAAVRRRVNVLIAADESIRRAADPFRVVELDAADIAVLKVAPLGGVQACLRIAEQIGLPVVVSSAVESSIGLAAGLALAAALPELPYACGLATTSLLDGDVVAQPLVPFDGFLAVGRQSLDETAFAAVAADPETDARWQARLAQVQAVLA